MPRSLSPVESLTYDPIRLHTEVVFKAKPKTTVKMVEDALMELHNVKGVTLKQIYSYLLASYDLQSISKVRVTLIKRYLKSLWESEDVANITGRGLLGRFKLVNKQMFARKIKINQNKAHILLNATKKSKTTTVKSNSRTNTSEEGDQFTVKSNKAKNSKKKQLHPLEYTAPVIPRQVTPVSLNPNTSSAFDTPIVHAEVQASTPFISSLITRAPEVRKRAYKIHKKTIPQDLNGTPRSSLSAKRRKLLKHPQK